MSQLFNRYEFKSPLPDYMTESILPTLLKYGMELDPSVQKHGNHFYTVNSLYFDSPLRDDYYDKGGGFINRKKIRIRVYEDILTQKTDEIWLEKKLKRDMHVAKKRICIPFEHYKELLKGSRAHMLALYKDSRYGAELLEDIIRQNMRPHVAVQYKRVPLIVPGSSDLRITLDSDIKACFSSDLCYSPAMTWVYPGTTVIEVKFSTLIPSWLKSLITRCGLQRASFSKYTNSVEALRTYNPLPR